jgi:hypothetical protein
MCPGRQGHGIFALSPDEFVGRLVDRFHAPASHTTVEALLDDPAAAAGWVSEWCTRASSFGCKFKRYVADQSGHSA